MRIIFRLNSNQKDHHYKEVVHACNKYKKHYEKLDLTDDEVGSTK